MFNINKMIKNTKQIKIIITGGGTGGHVVPLMVVAEELKKEFDILYIGSGNYLEKDSAEKLNIKYKSVMSGKYRRYFSFENFIDPFKIIIGLFQAFFDIILFYPKVIFAKGGYVTFPVVLAGWVLQVPVIVHESDTVLGLANRWEEKLARRVCVGWPLENYKDIPLQKIVFTGNPIRSEFSVEDKKHSDKNSKPTILVTGGSQGARFINQTIASMLKALTKKYHVIQIAGISDSEWLNQNRWPNYELFDFTDKMPLLMKKSDLIISRAGANTLAEISVLGKASILIPLPASANNHQWVNAKIFEKNHAAVVVSEKGLTPESLESIINHLMDDRKFLDEIGSNAKNLSQPNSTEAIIEEINKITKKE